MSVCENSAQRAAAEKAAGALFGVQRHKGAVFHQQGVKGVFFSFRPVAPVNTVRLGQGGDLLDPGDKAGVCGRGRAKTRNRGLSQIALLDVARRSASPGRLGRVDHHALFRAE